MKATKKQLIRLQKALQAMQGMVAVQVALNFQAVQETRELSQQFDLTFGDMEQGLANSISTINSLLDEMAVTEETETN